MALYAEVAVEAARGIARESYTYAVPDGMDVVPGHRVTVPFGRRISYGFVVSLGTEEPDVDTKPISTAGSEPLLLPHQVALARLVADHYWLPLIECIRAMLPPRVRGPGTTGAGASTRQRRHSRLLELATGQVSAAERFTLTAEQRAALEVIQANPVTLLHGVIASGKTEVYLAAAERALADGLRVLLLVPEISLTPQLVQRVRARLNAPVALLQSQLTELERAQQWWRARRGEAQVVLGSRSAVFAPIPRLGLICLDEEGSAAYKQDRTPRYEAGWVARQLASVTGARLVMGSATPSVATYHEAANDEVAMAKLTRRVRGNDAEVELVDMRDEAAEGNRQPLSRRLVELVTRTLENEEQTILYLNRRGMATFVMCRDCGRSVQCLGCSVALVQHAEIGGLVCHYCGYSRAMPAVCDFCGSRNIRALGLGTQRLETMARRLWPTARVLRLDSDAARGPDSYFNIWEEFSERRADILVGTQLVTRGLDLPAVTCVGVVDADLPLHFPDYRSAENTFALVAQVAGRAGRDGRPSRVIVQTSNPEHYALRCAAAGDYQGFYEAELPARKAFVFPPYADLAVLTRTDRDDARAAASAREAVESMAAGMLKEGIAGIRVMGPSPAFIHKLRGEYRWQVTLKGDGLERARHLAPRGKDWSYDVDPVS
ncbi:MAG: primosomal protein N' [Chloroflexi bacterium]|nr:MAG: primosomal protein N' [Chloroflexota bacterium]TME06544.1 MAG: primosomal protein N' [Chloroflexota bacterium]TME51988.1 MAG: primosomal protein N' [Chloroflexota bacterium]